MTIFEAVNSAVTPRMAAEHYGMTVARNGMVCCPFHNDRHPSMKLNEDYFYCFGCGAKGDVIEFTSKLFGITAMEAAQKLRADFGVQEDKPSILTKLNLYRTQADNERLCFRVLREYLQILQDWKVRFSPQTLEDDPDDRFVEDLQGIDRRECDTGTEAELRFSREHPEKAGNPAQAQRAGRAAAHCGCYPGRGHPCLFRAAIRASQSNETGNLRQ